MPEQELNFRVSTYFITLILLYKQRYQANLKLYVW